MELAFSRKIFEKYSNIKFRENPSRELNCSLRTDRHGITNSRFSPSFERAKKGLKLKSKWNIGQVHLPARSIAHNVTWHPCCQPVLLISAFLIRIQKYRWHTAVVKFNVVVRAAKSLRTPTVDMIREVPVPIRFSTVTPAIMTYFVIFLSFPQPDYGILSRLEQGLSFKILSSP